MIQAMKNTIHNSSKRETFDDIVFEHRNKAYGAFYMKKRTMRILIISFLISLLFVASLLIITLIQGNKPVGNILPPTSVHLITLQNEDNNDYVEYTLPPPSTENMVERTVYLPPVVVEKVTGTELRIPTEEIIKNAVNDPLKIELIPVEDPIPIIIEPDENKGFVFVQEPASFQGGDLNDFHAWVMKNIQYPQLAREYQIAGKVFVEFCVNTKGEVVDIQITRGLDASINNEVIRVLSASPLWTPARQQGRQVKQLFSMAVVFKLQQNL